MIVMRAILIVVLMLNLDVVRRKEEEEEDEEVQAIHILKGRTDPRKVVVNEDIEEGENTEIVPTPMTIVEAEVAEAVEEDVTEEDLTRQITRPIPELTQKGVRRRKRRSIDGVVTPPTQIQTRGADIDVVERKVEGDVVVVIHPVTPTIVTIQNDHAGEDTDDTVVTAHRTQMTQMIVEEVKEDVTRKRNTEDATQPVQMIVLLVMKNQEKRKISEEIVDEDDTIRIPIPVMILATVDRIVKRRSVVHPDHLAAIPVT